MNPTRASVRLRRRPCRHRVRQRADTPGRRKAARHSGSRAPPVPGLPPLPIAVGVAALAVSAGGASRSATRPGHRGQHASPAPAHSAAPARTPRPTCSTTRTAAVSRDSRRDALADAADEELVAQAETQARERNAALAQFAKQAEAQAAKIALNQWVLPLDSYDLTAGVRRGSDLWASVHTGLDFSASSAHPIQAIANGVVTEVGYDGSYGNKVVITLDDGTELWFCHHRLRHQRRRGASAPAR